MIDLETQGKSKQAQAWENMPNSLKNAIRMFSSLIVLRYTLHRGWIALLIPFALSIDDVQDCSSLEKVAQNDKCKQLYNRNPTHGKFIFWVIDKM